MGLLGKIGNFAKDYGPLAVGVYTAAKGSQAAGKADDYNAKALQMAEQQYAERAPLRDAGTRALSQIEAPIDLGNYMYDGGNPYAKARGPSKSVAFAGGWDQMTWNPKPAGGMPAGGSDVSSGTAPGATPPATMGQPIGGMAEHGLGVQPLPTAEDYQRWVMQNRNRRSRPVLGGG